MVELVVGCKLSTHDIHRRVADNDCLVTAAVCGRARRGHWFPLATARVGREPKEVIVGRVGLPVIELATEYDEFAGWQGTEGKIGPSTRAFASCDDDRRSFRILDL
jgi:hypothetical protein